MTADKILSYFINKTNIRFDGKCSDIKAVKTFFQSLVFILFTHINFHRIQPGTAYEPECMEKLGLIPSELVLFEKAMPDLSECLDEMALSVLGGNADLPLLRQELLSAEISFAKSGINGGIGKNTRDSLGSYYTPEPLAEEAVRKLIQDTAQCGRNSWDTISIADLSCGCGDFFSAAQKVLNEEMAIPYEKSALMFWGVDIDPVALQICVCSIMMQAKEADWGKIISHFRLGNPLLAAAFSGDYAKFKLFSEGRIYAADMGIDLESYIPQDGFDFIIGNPPWEKVRFEERKFYVNTCPSIAAMSKKDGRNAAIGRLQNDWPELYELGKELEKDYMSFGPAHASPFLCESLCGELNTYSMFTELAYRILNANGACSLIVKSTLVTAPAHKRLWRYLLDHDAVSSLCLFDNSGKLFPIDSRERFAVLTLTRCGIQRFSFAAGLSDIEGYRESSGILLAGEDILSVNPYTGMIPNISDTSDMDTLVNFHHKYPLFKDAFPDCHFGRLVHLTSHAEHIETKTSEDNIPIYEGKFIERYDARYSTFEGMQDDLKYVSKAHAAKCVFNPDGTKRLPESRFFIKKDFWEKISRQYVEPFSLCWRSLTSTTNRRTTIAMILPFIPTCQSIQFLQVPDEATLAFLLGMFNSKPFDYLVRLKMPGLDLTQSVINQIPVPVKEAFDRTASCNGRDASIKTHVLSCVCHILRNEPMVKPLIERLESRTYCLDGCVTSGEAMDMIDTMFEIAYGYDQKMHDKVESSFK